MSRKVAMIGAGSVVFCKVLMSDVMITPALDGCEFVCTVSYTSVKRD